MRKENLLLVLWVIFGFVFVMAIDSILYFLIHLLYFGLAEIGVSYKIMTYILPLLTLILYSFTAFIIFTRVNKKTTLTFSKLPKKLLIILSIVILSLAPFTDKLSEIYAQSISANTLLETGNYLLFYGWFNLGFVISQIVVLITLVGFSLIKIKRI